MMADLLLPRSFFGKPILKKIDQNQRPHYP